MSWICGVKKVHVMDISGRNILVVDDEETLREGLQTYLEIEGFKVTTASSAEEALSLPLHEFDLLILDIMMPGMSGTELACALKDSAATCNIPIIFLSAKGSDDDMVEGLNTGADDYIPKPYSIKNVIARIHAVLRRSSLQRESGIYCDRDSLACKIDGTMLKLPRKEFEILSLMLANPGRIFSRNELLDKVWPEKVVVTERSVDVHVARLRSKLGKYSRHIISRSGYGYGWED